MAFEGAGSAAVGGVFDLAGAGVQYAASKDLMKYQAKLNQKLRRQAYQDQTYSLREAGLNPILAASGGFGGGGGSASVGLAQAPNLSGIGSRNVAAGAAASSAKSKAVEAQTRQDLARVQVNLLKAQTETERFKQAANNADVLHKQSQAALNWATLPGVTEENRTRAERATGVTGALTGTSFGFIPGIEASLYRGWDAASKFWEQTEEERRRRSRASGRKPTQRRQPDKRRPTQRPGGRFQRRR